MSYPVQLAQTEPTRDLSFHMSTPRYNATYMPRDYSWPAQSTNEYLIAQQQLEARRLDGINSRSFPRKNEETQKLPQKMEAQPSYVRNWLCHFRLYVSARLGGIFKYHACILCLLIFERSVASGICRICAAFRITPFVDFSAFLILSCSKTAS